MTTEPFDGKPFAVEFDITIVDGEQGRRLAGIQAEAILNVLTWFHEHTEHAQTTRRQPIESGTGDQPAANGGA